MKSEKVYLWDNENIKTAADRPSIMPYVLDCRDKRPAILVIPGGAYGSVCENTEGSPIAKKFNELGYHAFVLDYRTAPQRFPAPQLDAMRAIRLIRANADRWNIDPEWVISCGFSAGAHLAASLGTLCFDIKTEVKDIVDSFSSVPNAMILCYGVLQYDQSGHTGSFVNLLGKDKMDTAHKYSLPELVNEKTPPAFLMHTICDQVVPFRNSIAFAEAMAKHKRPCELSLYYWGAHGMLLGNDTLDVINWPCQAMEFVESLKQEQYDPDFRQKYTNAYQYKTIKK